MLFLKWCIAAQRHGNGPLFTFGLSSLLRTLSHRQAPELGAFLGDTSPSSETGWSAPSSSLGPHSLILSGIGVTQLQKAAFSERPDQRCAELQAERSRSFFPEQLVTERIVYKILDDLPRCVRAESQYNSPWRRPVAASFGWKKVGSGSRRRNKARQAARHVCFCVVLLPWWIWGISSWESPPTLITHVHTSVTVRSAGQKSTAWIRIFFFPLSFSEHYSSNVFISEIFGAVYMFLWLFLVLKSAWKRVWAYIWCV